MNVKADKEYYLLEFTCDCLLIGNVTPVFFGKRPLQVSISSLTAAMERPFFYDYKL